jgi:hypothetical protein
MKVTVYTDIYHSETTDPATKQNKYRPASSIYSQPSPNQPTSRFPQNSYQAAVKSYEEQVEISPPSSPDIPPRGVPSRKYVRARVVLSGSNTDIAVPSQPQTGHMRTDISLVDEMPQVAPLNVGPKGQKAESSIPILRREKRRNQAAAAASNILRKDLEQDGHSPRPINNPRWDDMTGEPTTSEKGRPQTTKPGDFDPLRTYGSSYGHSAHVTATPPKNQPSFTDRIRKIKENNNLIMGGNRPEWKGASTTGRTTFVPPVEDKPDAPPLIIPRKSSKRNSPGAGNSRTNSPANSTPLVSPTQGSYPNQTIKPVQPSAQYQQQAQTPIYVEDPLFSPQNGPLSQNPQRPPMISTQPRRPVPSSLAPQSAPQPLKHQPSTSSIERKFREALKDVNVSAARDQPVSRFSVTTYATTTADSSPRMSTSTPPPMPTPPLQSQESLQALKQVPSPIVNRRRPVANRDFDDGKGRGGGGAGGGVPRKMIGEPRVVGVGWNGHALMPADHKPYTGSALVVNENANADRRASSATEKLLPKSPPEAMAGLERHAALQAQLDDLFHQRLNLERSIKQMTELIPAIASRRTSATGPIDVRNVPIGSRDLIAEGRRREEEKQKVKRLEEDLADVKREEYEVGMKLHRVLKRMDERSIYAPEGLWVRRVTE